MLAQAVRELLADGVPAKPPPLGMMVEVPAAALSIDAFDADFYSIGSNDLLQYLMAASRDEPELSALASPGPAFLARRARDGAAWARAVQREVSLCGDLASDIRHVPRALEMWTAHAVGRTRGSGRGQGGRATDVSRAVESTAKSEPRRSASRRISACCGRCWTAGRPACASDWRKRSRKIAASSRSSPTRLPDADSLAARGAHLRGLPLLAARARALPRRLSRCASAPAASIEEERERQREITIALPDLGTDARNRRLEAIVKEFAEKVARLLREPQ